MDTNQDSAQSEASRPVNLMEDLGFSDNDPQVIAARAYAKLSDELEAELGPDPKGNGWLPQSESSIGAAIVLTVSAVAAIATMSFAVLWAVKLWTQAS